MEPETIFSPQGVIQLCNRLSFKRGHDFKVRARVLAERLCKSFEPIKDQQPYKEKLMSINRLISKVYLLEKVMWAAIETYSEEMLHTVGDRKIIKVLTLWQEILELKRVKAQSFWRDERMDGFIQEVDKVIESRVQTLILENVSKDDYECIFTTKQIFSHSTNKEQYNRLISRLPFRGDDLASSEINILYTALSNCLYSQLYRYSKLQKQFKPIRLQLMYLHCLTKSFCPQLEVSSQQKSMVHLGLQWKGFEVWEIYFEEISMARMDSELAFLKNPVMNSVAERNSVSESSEPMPYP